MDESIRLADEHGSAIEDQLETQDAPQQFAEVNPGPPPVIGEQNDALSPEDEATAQWMLDAYQRRAEIEQALALAERRQSAQATEQPSVIPGTNTTAPAGWPYMDPETQDQIRIQALRDEIRNEVMGEVQSTIAPIAAERISAQIRESVPEAAKSFVDGYVSDYLKRNPANSLGKPQMEGIAKLAVGEAFQKGLLSGGSQVFTPTPKAPSGTMPQPLPTGQAVESLSPELQAIVDRSGFSGEEREKFSSLVLDAYNRRAK